MDRIKEECVYIMSQSHMSHLNIFDGFMREIRVQGLRDVEYGDWYSKEENEEK